MMADGRVTLCLKTKNNLTWEYENHKQAWSQAECNESGICVDERGSGEAGRDGGREGGGMKGGRERRII